MSSSRDHVAPLPRGFITVRILQLILAFTICCLTIFMLVEVSAKGPHYYESWNFGYPILIGIVRTHYPHKPYSELKKKTSLTIIPVRHNLWSRILHPARHLRLA